MKQISLCLVLLLFFACQNTEKVREANISYEEHSGEEYKAPKPAAPDTSNKIAPKDDLLTLYVKDLIKGNSKS
jgi:hypothetical protein